MYRKRGDIASKKAQVTIFIIVGIIILFVFLFIFQLISKMQEEQLGISREEIFAKVFQKEALRVYVEDCLEDSLVDGLILIGKQGGIWREQGGLWDFSESKGISFAGDNIFYGIVSTPPSEARDAVYPWPDTLFGRPELNLRSLERDLRKYLTNETMSCMENFTKANISQAAKLTWDGANVEVNFVDGGIAVKTHFPLKFTLPGDDFFHLSQFDFFFPTRMKDFLDAAVLKPFGWEIKHIDFNYTGEVMNKDFFVYGTAPNAVVGEECEAGDNLFLCKKPISAYRDFGVEFANYSLDEGTDLFILKPSWDEDKLRDFEFRIARQNRPPVMDYISRCPGTTNGENYDYLVISGDRNFADIKIKMNALDPDEDAVKYELKNDGSPIVPTDLNKPNEFNLMVPQSWSDPINTLQANVFDEHELNDTQEVKVFQGTHDNAACCVLDDSPQGWSAGSPNTKCFENSAPGCYGQITAFTTISGFKTYILEKQVRLCSSDGMCDGEYANELWNEELRCGNNNNQYETGDIGCSGIAPQCEGNLSYGYVDENNDGTNDGWCHGKMGCSEFCYNYNEVVQLLPTEKTPNELAKEVGLQGIYTEDYLSSYFICGCENVQTPGRYECDSNFDGVFNGHCEESSCGGDDT